MPRPIDHLVLAVHDLDAAGAFYERLGFKVGVRNRHPWGTENRIVQFAGSFLELITIGKDAQIVPHGPRRFSFGAFLADHLNKGQRFAMLVLKSDNAAADAAAFAAAGIGDFEPFFFERRGRRPDGSETRLAFSLAFARDDKAPDAGFFVCQLHDPENFWNAAFQQHPNGAVAIASATMVAENPSDHHVFLSAFTGERELHATSLGLSVPVPGGKIEVLTPAAADTLYGLVPASEAGAALIAFSVRVGDLAALESQLRMAGVPASFIAGRLVVAPEAAFGTAIAFEAAEQS